MIMSNSIFLFNTEPLMKKESKQFEQLSLTYVVQLPSVFYFYGNCLCPSSLLRFRNAFETIVCICRDNSVCLNVILLNKTCVDILSHTHISSFLPDVQFKDFMRTQNNRSLNLTFISCQFSRLNKKISYSLMQ